LEEYKWAPFFLSKHPITPLLHFVIHCNYNFGLQTRWSTSVDFLAKFKPKLQTCVFFEAFQVPSYVFV